MKTFTDQLIERIKAKKTILCAGLDPQLSQMPPYLLKECQEREKDPVKAVALCFLEFNKLIIDAVEPWVAVVKPQMAFYEQYGSAGIAAYEETVKYAKAKGLLVITDAKRGDGSDTVKAYARAFLGEVETGAGKSVAASFLTDALTIHGWIGRACIDPFVEEIKQRGRGAFVVVKTSFDPNSEVENIKSENGDPVWVELARMVKEWGKDTIGEQGYMNLGVVVGATYPEEGKQMRELLPQGWFLVPGYGAQGGGADGAVISADEKGLGIIVNSSRGISAAYQKGPFAKDLPEGQGFEKIAAQAAEFSRNELNEALKKAKNPAWLA